MPAACLLLLILPAIVMAHAASAADSLSPAFSGKTLSAIAYVERRQAARGSSGLTRLMFQAYLETGGGTLVRVWDPLRNAYTPPGRGSWSLNGSRLCLDRIAAGRLCADIHIWGPRIAGVGIDPYVMLDGDLEAGCLRAS